MRYYIKNEDGGVVAKFDGIDVEVKEKDEKVEVGSVQKLSDIEVNWAEHYEQL